MPELTLETKINAPIERCFLLSLSIELHMAGTSGTEEKAVGGVTSGVLKLNDTVTWQARHFGIRQKLTSKITAYEKPFLFVDEMLSGAFKMIHHTHLFREENGVTIMTDHFTYKAPLGFLGRIAEKMILSNYLRNFILKRNAVLKETAESDDWKKYI
ncbi:MAG: cell division protein [Bacteroidetes bacterium]|nr:cell division protein [Bacteroidota bacterium]